MNTLDYIIPDLVTVLTASASFIELEMYDTADTATFRGVRAWRHMSPLFGQKKNTNLAWKLKTNTIIKSNQIKSFIG
jgi:hypothetical protein